MSSEDKEASNVSSTGVSWNVLKDQYIDQFIDRLHVASGISRADLASAEDLAATHQSVFQYRLKTGTNCTSKASKDDWAKRSASAWAISDKLIKELEQRISDLNNTDHIEEPVAGTVGDRPPAPYNDHEQIEILNEFSSQVTIIDLAIIMMSRI